MLTWKTPELKSGYPYRCHRAVSDSSGCEYWARQRAGDGQWRLLVFGPAGYVGATNHWSLQDAQDAAEEWEALLPQPDSLSRGAGRGRRRR